MGPHPDRPQKFKKTIRFLRFHPSWRTRVDGKMLESYQFLNLRLLQPHLARPRRTQGVALFALRRHQNTISFRRSTDCCRSLAVLGRMDRWAGWVDEREGRLGGWMEGWMDGWMAGRIAGMDWMDGCVEGLMGAFMDGRVDGWMDGWICGWTRGWMGGWKDGRTHGWMDVGTGELRNIRRASLVSKNWLGGMPGNLNLNWKQTGQFVSSYKFKFLGTEFAGRAWL